MDEGLDPRTENGSWWLRIARIGHNALPEYMVGTSRAGTWKTQFLKEREGAPSLHGAGKSSNHAGNHYVSRLGGWTGIQPSNKPGST